jgi:hypothetical protein
MLKRSQEFRTIWSRFRPSPLQEFLLRVVKLRGIPFCNKDTNLISFRSTQSKRKSATENLISSYRIWKYNEYGRWNDNAVWRSMCEHWPQGGRGVKTNIRTERGVKCASLTICTVQVPPSPPPMPSVAQQPLAGQCPFNVAASRSHSGTPHSVWLLWMSDQPDAETFNLITHNTLKRQTFMPPARLEPAIPVSVWP